MSFVKNLLLLVMVVGIIAGGIFYTARNDAEYINVRMNLTQFDNNSAPRIDNMTAFLVPVSKISEPKGTQAFTPGIIIKIFQNQEGITTDISDWVSVPYNGNGTYNMAVGLYKYPKPGEFVLINVRLIDAEGTEFTSVTYNTQLG